MGSRGIEGAIGGMVFQPFARLLRDRPLEGVRDTRPETAGPVIKSLRGLIDPRLPGGLVVGYPFGHHVVQRAAFLVDL